jgi:hypothetical protein
MFNPGTGPDRYWTEGPPKFIHHKKPKVARILYTKPGVRINTQEDEGIYPIYSTEVEFDGDSLKPRALPFVQMNKPTIEHGEEDSDATVAIEEDDESINGKSSLPGKTEERILATPPPSQVIQMVHTTPPKRETNEVGTNARVGISHDDLSVNTGSPRPSPTIKSLLAESSPRWISGSIQSLIMNSIDWRGLRNSIKDDIVGVIDHKSMRAEIKQSIKDSLIGNTSIESVDHNNIPKGLRLKDLVNKQEVNAIVSLVAKKAIFKSISFQQLEEEMVQQVMYAMDFESLKAKAMEKIVRNGAPVSQLEALMKSVGDDMDV